MIQIGTITDIIDNSGAKQGFCIKVVLGRNKRYASLGDIILVSIKKLRNKRRMNSKVKKGYLYKGVVVTTVNEVVGVCGEKVSFLKNSIVLLNTQGKVLGTRTLGSLPIKLRYCGFLRILSMSSGVLL